jgi:glycosyltransferase involved in cell wall biosynthesis
LDILVSSIVDLKNSQHNRPHQFIKHLSKNHRVTVLSINDWWKKDQETQDTYRKDLEKYLVNVELIPLTEKKVSPILQEFLFRKEIKNVLKNNYDVHLNYNTIFSGRLPTQEIKTVYDLADDLSAMIRDSPQIPASLRPIGGFLGDSLIRRNLKSSDKITITTEGLIKSYSVPKEKYSVIPNGVDTNNFINYGSSIKNKLDLSGFIIGYVGVLREWVDLKPVFLALKNLDTEISMLIVGSEGDFNKNVNLARSCGVLDRVIFTGTVPYSQVPKYISAMDVCLIPFSKNAVSENALPLKLFEYMACEKPVISTELTGVRKAVDNLVIYANNEKDYEYSILKLFTDDNLRHELGKKGRSFVELNYDWKQIVKKLENVLVETAEDK